MSVLLDTCALIWWTLDRDKLTKNALAALESDIRVEIFISSISIWEIGIKIKNGKLDIGTDIADYTARLKRLGRLSIIPVDEAVWLKNLSLNWAHRDPADRTIVATAMLHRLPVISADTGMAKFYSEVIW